MLGAMLCYDEVKTRMDGRPSDGRARTVRRATQIRNINLFTNNELYLYRVC